METKFNLLIIMLIDAISSITYTDIINLLYKIGGNHENIFR